MISNVGKKKTAILTYDAGGSELLAAWVKRQSAKSVEVFVEGPGKKVFERRIPDFKKVRKLKEIKKEIRANKFARVITSVNWGTQVDKEVWALCRKVKIPCILFLERWPLATETFFFDGHYELPDQIWIAGDSRPYADALLILQALKIPLIKKRNYYLEDQVSRIKKLSKRFEKEFSKKKQKSVSHNRLLFAAENLSSAEKALGYAPRSLRGYDEYMALDYFLSEVAAGNLGKDPEVLIRPHPSESFKKYESTVEKYQKNLNLRFSLPNDSLEENLAWSTKLVSFQSFAIDVARLANKEVVRLKFPLQLKMSIP